MSEASASRPIVECVPNVSEGRDPEVIEAIRVAAASVPDVALLDVDSDEWHNRTVYTFVGPAEEVGEAAFRLVREAAGRIDLRRHRGQHPRIGAADVVPFVPLTGLDLGGLAAGSLQACKALAGRVGQRIAGELGIPVFLYGEAARRPERAVPAPFRKGGFEALRESIGRDPVRLPDFGSGRVHPSAGATAVGARTLLVAYNVFLDTDDVEVASAIARAIRESSGGLPRVQALGFLVRGRAQVSTNLLDVDATPPAAVWSAVREEAVRLGTRALRGEIVGLAPERCLPEEGAPLGLEIDPRSRALEPRIREVLRAD
ncbi:MAG TPA: glutamate formimidoyltransferase [Gemmatimonadota bacterium]|nr:glutamate formimidoyltransferase [Gemmatimonadota bacterium]